MQQSEGACNLRMRDRPGGHSDGAPSHSRLMPARTSTRPGASLMTRLSAEAMVTITAWSPGRRDGRHAPRSRRRPCAAARWTTDDQARFRSAGVRRVEPTTLDRHRFVNRSETVYAVPWRLDKTTTPEMGIRRAHSAARSGPDESTHACYATATAGPWPAGRLAP